MKYKKEYSRILKNIEKWKVELKKLQETCSHEDISGCYDSSGSYYDEMVYWVRVECRDCGMNKSFSATDNRKEYNCWVDRIRNQGE